MPIVVDSSQWTGEQDDAAQAGPMVWGEFAERETLDRAAERLQEEPWFRQAFEQNETPAEGRPADNAQQVDKPDEDPKGADRRNLRQNFVGIGTAASSMAAAGVVIASGGAALPAVAAAAAAGAVAAAATETAGNTVSQADAEAKAPMRTEGPALGIRASTAELQQQAEAFLQQAGARHVWVQHAPMS
ncbi:hypothetical protein [Roseicella frigidaeris]|uniref:Uncharacterized protein n=1 Tax=Roseicella frigidaeris TaxID=2230885 RepID=A0A327MDA2_9PROT|nr:hypothetical protein [Roseicella frigidaeris]RAI60647.1 hypothetical protein DOO78_00480 [Roseicella frigidaeris]